jgi:O-methyltransferase
MAVSLEEVRENFERYGLLDHQVRFLKGFFGHTLPYAPIERLAILRVDADLHCSTLDVLNNLYQRLSPGGYAIFDDYQNLPDCKRAINEFRTAHGIREEIRKVDSRAVYWRRGN